MGDTKKIYQFLKDNNLTQKSEQEFVTTYSDSTKAKELFGFFEQNKLTQKGFDDFYSEYFAPTNGTNNVKTEDVQTEQLTTETKPDTNGFKLSFQEQPKTNVPDYMGLFDKKEDVKIAKENGVSVSFYDEVKKSAAAAEYPTGYIAEANNLKNRLEEMPKYFPELAGQAAELKSKIASISPSNIEQFKEAVSNLEMSNVGEQIRQGNFYVPSGKRQEYYDKVVNDPFVSAIKMLEEDSKDLKAAATGKSESLVGTALSMGQQPGAKLLGGAYTLGEKIIEGEGKNVLKGSAKGLENYVEGYTQLLQDIKGNEAVNTVLTKLENEESLTTEDKLLLKSIYDNANLHKELDKEIPASYKIGESLGQSAGFMLEFGALGGVTGGVGKAVLKGGAKLGIASKGGKLGLNAAIKLAQTGIQTPLMPSMWKNTALDISKGEEPWKAVLNNAWQTAAETGSERIFLVNPVKGAGGTANALLRRAGINFNVDKGAVGVLRNMGEEYLEEKVGEIMTSPKDYNSFKDFWKGFVDKENNLVTFGATSLMTGGMGSVALSGNAISKARYEARVAKAEKLLPQDIRAEIDVIIDNKDLTVQQQYQLVGELVGDRIDKGELTENPNEIAANTIQYLNYKTQQISAEATDKSAKVENGEITIGEVEEGDTATQQEQLDYLKEKGVEVPDGTSMDNLNKLYNETKTKINPIAENGTITKTAPMPEFMNNKYYTESDRKQFKEEQESGRFDYQEDENGDVIVHRGMTEGAVGMDLHGGVGSTWTIFKEHAKDYGDVTSMVLPKETKTLKLVDQVTSEINDEALVELSKISKVPIEKLRGVPAYDAWQIADDNYEEGQLARKIKKAGYDAISTQGIEGNEIYILNNKVLKPLKTKEDESGRNGIPERTGDDGIATEEKQAVQERTELLGGEPEVKPIESGEKTAEADKAAAEAEVVENKNKLPQADVKELKEAEKVFKGSYYGLQPKNALTKLLGAISVFERDYNNEASKEKVNELNRIANSYKETLGIPINTEQKESTVKSETEKKITKQKTETSEIQPTETKTVEPKLPKKETVKEEKEIKVTKFKEGSGGTKGTFKDENGKIYKSIIPQEGVFEDGKAKRVPIKDKLTDEHTILSELQDKPYVPKVGKVVETSEGKAFEIEELEEADNITKDEYVKLRQQVNELNDNGYFISDKVSVMRRKNGELVITDFSNAYKGDRGSRDVDSMMDVEEKLSKQDKAWVDLQKSADNARKTSELFKGETKPNEYLLTQRPPSIGTHPIENIVGDPVEQQMDGRSVWKLTYSKPLSSEDIKRFELSPVLPINEYMGKIVDGITDGFQFYVKNIKDRTVTLEAVSPTGKRVENKMRSGEFLEKVQNGTLKLSEPTIDKLSQTPKQKTTTPKSTVYTKVTKALNIVGKDLVSSLGKTARNGKINGVDVVVQQGNTDNEIIIESMRTPSSFRQKGKATKALQTVTEQADKNGITLKLRAVPQKGSKITEQQLKSFYEKNGFEFEGIEGTRIPNKGTTKRITAFHGTSTESAEKVKSGKFSELKRKFVWITENKEESKRFGKEVVEITYPENAKVFNGDVINMKYLRDNGFKTEQEAYEDLKKQGYDIISFQNGLNKLILNNDILEISSNKEVQDKETAKAETPKENTKADLYDQRVSYIPEGQTEPLVGDVMRFENGKVLVKMDDGKSFYAKPNELTIVEKTVETEVEIPKSKDGLYQIYPVKVKNKDGGIDNYFGVPSPLNKGLRGFGDDLVNTLEQAIKTADYNRFQEGVIAKRKAEQEEANKKREAEAIAKKEAQKGKTKLEIMNEAKDAKILNTKERRNGVVKTRKEHTEDIINNGGYTETKQVNKVKDVSRTTYNRMDNRQQEDLERRIKEGGKKTEYRLVTKDGTYFDITKAEYDYANQIVSKQSKSTEDGKEKRQGQGRQEVLTAQKESDITGYKSGNITEPKVSPLTKQYNGIKEQYPDATVLFELEDFYQIIGDDAVKISEILGTPLTTNGSGQKLTGFAKYKIDEFLPKLVKAGTKVAIVDKPTVEYNNKIAKTKSKERKTIVLDEGNGIIINDLWNEFNAIKNQKEQDFWDNKVKNTTFGTYGTMSIFEVLEKFEPKYPNEVLKKDFISGLEQALNVPKDKRTYQPKMTPLKPEVTPTEEKKITKATGIKPKNLKDVYKAGREIFGLTRSQALAQAIIVNIVVNKIAKNRGVTAEKVWGEIEFKKGAVQGKDVLYQQAKAAMFYSPTEKALTKIQQNKGTVEQFKAMLLKNGAKQAELDWMGWDERFPDSKKTITKAEVQDWIDRNKIEVEEVQKGKGRIWDGDNLINVNGETVATLVDNEDGTWSFTSNFSEGEDYFESKERAKLAAEQETVEDIYGESATKYEQYQLPGGENYKEVLLTMPNNIIPDFKIIERNVESNEGDDYIMYDVIDRNTNQLWSSHRDKEQADIAVKNKLNRQKLAAKDSQFKSSHFNEPNILAHIRFNERTDSEGNRVLFLEEIQSDWAQHGKKEGFKGDKAIYKELNDLEAQLQQTNSDLDETIKEAYKAGLPTGASSTEFKMFEEGKVKETYALERQLQTVRNNKEWDEITAQIESIKNNAIQLGRKRRMLISQRDNIEQLIEKEKRTASRKEDDAVPDMPFKQTPQWVNLALRRMIRYAAENGFDRIAWTTGEQQAERYDLSKQVDYIRKHSESSINKEKNQIDVTISLTNGMFGLEVEKTSGKIVGQNGSTNIGDFIGKGLDEVIGKEIASKIIKLDEGEHTLKDADLKVGGEGMKAFYDAIVPNAANKLGKQFGAKVEEIDINNGGKIDMSSGVLDLNQAVNVLSLPITPSMRESALNEGMPLFQKQGTGKTAKGAIQFLADGNAIISALTNPNVSTPLHEIAHLYERYMPDSERKAVLKWAKHKTWSTETSEMFARGFEKYLATGIAPTTELQKIFDRFKKWLTEIYNGITGSEIDIELNDAMRDVYNAMLGEGTVKPKKTETKPILSENDYINSGIEKHIKDNKLNKAKFEESEEYDEVFNELSNSYPAYIQQLSKSGELQEMFDNATIGEQITIRKNIQTAGLEVEDMLDLTKKKEEYKAQKEAEYKAKKERITEELGLNEPRKQREEAAKAKIADGFSSLANIIGAKKSLTGEERESAIKAIQNIIEGLVELGIAKGMSIKDAVNKYLKEQKLKVDQKLLDEAIKRHRQNKKKELDLSKVKSKKLPTEQTKVTITGREALRAWLTAQKIGIRNFQKSIDGLREMLKESESKDFISYGEYLSVFRRLTAATNNEQLQKVFEYAEEIIEKGEHKQQSATAKKFLGKLKDTRNKFGTAIGLVDRLLKGTNLNTLTVEELKRFNEIASKIKVDGSTPVVFPLPELVSFIESINEENREQEKQIKIYSIADIEAEIKDLEEKLTKGFTNRADVLSAQRKLNRIRRIALGLMSGSSLTAEETDKLQTLLGNNMDSQFEGGGLEQEIVEEKNRYIDNILENIKTQGTKIANQMKDLPEEFRKPLFRLLSAKKADLEKLSIADLESFDRAVFNLAEGFLTPSVAELETTLGTNRLTETVNKVFNTVRGARQWKNFLKKHGGDADFQKKLVEFLRTQSKHRIDTWLGNYDRENTIGALYSIMGRGITAENATFKKYDTQLKDAYAKIKKIFPKKIGNKKIPNTVSRQETKRITQWVGFLLAEKAWRAAPNYVEEFADETNASINHFNYVVNAKETLEKSNDKKSLPEEIGLYNDFMAYLKVNGATKEIGGVEVMDTEKAEELLRQTKEVGEFIDTITDIFAQTKAMAEWSAYINGRSFIETGEYFPYISKAKNKVVDIENIHAQMINNRMQPKMKSGSTMEKKYIPHYIETNPMTAVDAYLQGISRNYNVFPEIRKVMGAVINAGKEGFRQDIESKESAYIDSLSRAIISDMKYSLDMHYRLNDFRMQHVAMNKFMRKGWSAVKKGMLANIERVAPEFGANSFRGVESIGKIPVSDIKDILKNKNIYSKIIEDYIGERYMSRWGEEIKQDVYSNKVLKAGEDAANWMITFSDTQVGRVLFVNSFKESYKKDTGQEFDPKRYESDFNYRMENEVAIEKAATKGLRKVEELFNDKAPLSSPTLISFFGGIIKGHPTNFWTQLFNFLQSFNRNEFNQINDSVKRMRYSTNPADKALAKRDIIAVVGSNAIYAITRTAMGVLVNSIIQSITGGDDDEYTYEQKEKLKTWRFYRDAFLTQTATLPMGGSQQAYLYTYKLLMPTLIEKTNILDKRETENVKKFMSDYFYVKHINLGWGSGKQTLMAALPVPTPAQDVMNGLEDIAALIDAIDSYVPSEKKKLAIYELIILSVKYSWINPVTPGLQKRVTKARNAEFRKKTTSSGNPSGFDAESYLFEEGGFLDNEIQDFQRFGDLTNGNFGDEAPEIVEDYGFE